MRCAGRILQIIPCVPGCYAQYDNGTSLSVVGLALIEYPNAQREVEGLVFTRNAIVPATDVHYIKFGGYGFEGSCENRNE